MKSDRKGISVVNILFFSNDGKLGDAVLHTALVKGIKESDPKAKIYCMTAGSTTDFWQRDPRIENSWDFWKPSFWQAIKLGLIVRKKKLDYIISWNTIKNEKLKIFCWLANPKFGTKVFVVKSDEHASIKEKRVLEMLGYNTKNLSYDVHFSNKEQFEWDKNSLFFNIFASTVPRSIHPSIVIKIINKLRELNFNNTIYITCFDNNRNIVDEIIKKSNQTNIVAVDCNNNIDKLISLCAQVNTILTPDTAIVHLGSAFNKPIIELLEKDNLLLKTNWGPKSNKYKLIEFFNTNQSEKELIEIIVNSVLSFHQ